MIVGFELYGIECGCRVVRDFIQFWETWKRAMHCWGKLVSPNALVYSRDLCATTEISAQSFSLYPSPQALKCHA